MVDVTFVKKSGQFTIFGPLRNVQAAVICLQNKLRQYKEMVDNRKAVDVLYNQTRWHWLSENQMASETEVPYDMVTSFIIETAYSSGKQTIQLQTKDGKMYVIDLEKLVEYLKINVNDSVMVIRRDVLKPDVQKWFYIASAMNNNENVMRVALDDGKEYQKVKKLFLDEGTNDRDPSKDNSRSIQIVKVSIE